MINKKTIQDVGKRSEPAFNEIYDEYATNVAAFVGSIVHNVENAKDITQELFIELPALIQNNFEFLSVSQFKNWLYTIAKRRALDFLSANKEILELKEDIGILHVDSDESINLLYLKNMFNKLEYDVFVLHFYKDFTFNEIAKELNITIDVAKKTYVKAVKIIKKNHLGEVEKYEKIK